ncbi:hypothetical protein KCU81_g380, partial [Aureobasidium melanogenum]
MNGYDTGVPAVKIQQTYLSLYAEHLEKADQVPRARVIGLTRSLTGLCFFVSIVVLRIRCLSSMMLTASESIEILVDWVQDYAQLLRTGSCGPDTCKLPRFLEILKTQTSHRSRIERMVGDVFIEIGETTSRSIPHRMKGSQPQSKETFQKSKKTVSWSQGQFAIG